MLTNGVDPYNGSTALVNQDSPYVEAAQADAQRAGVAVYSIAYGDAGMRGGSASFSGQSYLQQVADATGGRSFYQGTGNPVRCGRSWGVPLGGCGELYGDVYGKSNHERPNTLTRVKITSSQPS